MSGGAEGLGQKAEGGRQKAGGVPEGWRAVKLAEVCRKITKGTTPSNLGHTFSETGINFVKIESILENGSFHVGKFAKISEETHESLKRSQLAEDDILISIAGALGRVALVKKDILPANTNQAVSIVKPDANIDPRFLFSALRGSKIQNLISEIKTTGAQPNINLKQVGRFPILLPPLPEQRKIAAILSTWDDSLATLARLIAAKQQQKRGLAEALLTGKKRLPGFEGEWEEKKLGDFLRESRITGSDGLTARKLTVKLWGKGVYEKQEKLQGSENTKYFKRRAGQLIFSKLDFLNGAFGIVPEHLDGLESTLDLPCFDFLDGLNPTFVLEYISRDDFYSRFESGAIGGRKARRVTPDEFLKTTIPLPPLLEQRAIASVLSTLDGEIASLTQLRGALERQKRGLMDVLLTGRVRVKVGSEMADMGGAARSGAVPEGSARPQAHGGLL